MRSSIRPCCLAAALVVGAGAALAQPAERVDCRSPQNTIEVNECAARDLKARDRELNEAYRALVASLKPEMAGDTTDYAAVKAKLAAAQKAWIAFRDADCAALYTYYMDGTIRTVKELSCRIEHTVQRTRELKGWARP